MPEQAVTMDPTFITMEQGIALIVDKMIDDYFHTSRNDRMKQDFINSIRIEQLQKWVRIHASGGVRAFVVTAPNVERVGGGLFEIGDILKPAGVNAPTKNFARGNIFKKDGLKSIRWTGA